MSSSASACIVRSLLLAVSQSLQSLAQVSDAGLEVDRPPDSQAFLVEPAGQGVVPLLYGPIPAIGERFGCLVDHDRPLLSVSRSSTARETAALYGSAVPTLSSKSGRKRNV